MSGVSLVGTRLPGADLPLADHAAVAAFVAASGDDNPLHSDIAAARAAGFDDIVVPGMLIMGQMAEVLRGWPACDRIGWFLCRFVDPVAVGTALRCEGRIVARDPSGGVIARMTAGVGRRFVVVGEVLIHPA
jgi:acyl dehydratase